MRHPECFSKTVATTRELLLNTVTTHRCAIVSAILLVFAFVLPAAGSDATDTLIVKDQPFPEVKRATFDPEQILSSIFRAAPGGVGVVINRHLEIINDYVVNLTGYSREELVGQSAKMLYPSIEDFNYVGNEKYRQIGKYGTGTVETRWMHKDGSIINVILSSTPLDLDSLEAGVAFTVLDITERLMVAEALGRRTALFVAGISSVSLVLLLLTIWLVLSLHRQRLATAALLKSEERFKSIIAVSNTGAWEYHRNRDYLWCSPEYFTMLGIDPYEYSYSQRNLREIWIDLIHPDDRNTASEHFLRYLSGGSVGMYENYFRMRKADGEWLWIWSRGQTLRNPDGSVSDTTVGTHIDITERKKAQLALEAQKDRLAVTLRSIGDGVITTDINGDVVLMNRVAEELTGWKQEEARGKEFTSIFTIIDETTRAPHENPVEKVLATGKVVGLKKQPLLISRDGTEHVVADSGAPIIDKDGKTVGVVLVFRDITEKQRFIEISQNTQKLQSLAVLAGGIAHDFNNLLGGIYGYIDMACEASTHETVNDYLEKTLSTIERARALTGQLLTFAKGGAPIRKRDLLTPFLEETVLFSLSGSNVSSSFDIQKELWRCNYDKNQIAQVVDNLVINAQQAMPFGGVVSVSACNVSLGENEHSLLRGGEYIKISIRDKGVGIPKELRSRIFDPFFTTKSKGHGLGLSTCYSIINRHGGCIDVESEPGEGSVFDVYLPACRENVSDSQKPTAMTHRGRGTILLMDDEEVMREIVTNMLTSLGYTVIAKKDGREAADCVATASKNGWTLSAIIVDLTVPGGMGGKEALGEIRKRNSSVPVFVASGYAEDPVMMQPQEHGFSASICKPFRRSELMGMLERHLNIS